MSTPYGAPPQGYTPVDTRLPHTVGGPYRRLPFPGTEELNPADVFAAPGYTAPRPPRAAAAVVALVAGLLSTFIPIAPLVAIGFGHWALYQLRTQHVSGRGMAVAGLTLGYMLLVFWVFLGLLYAANS